MKQTLRIVFLLLILAWASVGDAYAASQQRKDRLRWNDVAQQETPQAVLNDSHSTMRIVPTRPQSITPLGNSKTQPTHGRTFSALYSHYQFFFGNCVAAYCLGGIVKPQYSCVKTFIALRHIIR